MSFYRKYRPQIIEDIDNPVVQRKLQELLKKEKKELPHAFLFSGPKGAGKTTSARIIAKIFNCTNPTKTGAPCGACDQCRSIADGSNIDVLELDAASNRGIDEIRSVRDSIHLAPSSSAYKVYIIDEVHMLTTEAFNALLKTLEEPPAHAIFILATTDPQKIPATILSRCVSIPFGFAGEEELTHALKRIAQAENITITPEALTELTQYAEGSFRDAVKLLEQVSFHGGDITLDVVQSELTISSKKHIENLLASLVAKDVKHAMATVKELEKNGVDLKRFTIDTLKFLEQTLVAGITGKKDGAYTQEALLGLIALFTRVYQDMKNSPIAALPLEVGVVEYCSASKAPVSTPVATSVAPSPARVVPPVVVPKEVQKAEEQPVSHQVEKQSPHTTSATPMPEDLGLLTLEKLVDCWRDFIEEVKPFNHSVSGVLRSSRPKSVSGGIVVIEAFYTFHQEKLSEVKTKEILTSVLKKLFGEKVSVEIVLGKK